MCFFNESVLLMMQSITFNRILKEVHDLKKRFDKWKCIKKASSDCVTVND